MPVPYFLLSSVILILRPPPPRPPPRPPRPLRPLLRGLLLLSLPPLPFSEHQYLSLFLLPYLFFSFHFSFCPSFFFSIVHFSPCNSNPSPIYGPRPHLAQTTATATRKKPPNQLPPLQSCLSNRRKTSFTFNNTPFHSFTLL